MQVSTRTTKIVLGRDHIICKLPLLAPFWRRDLPNRAGSTNRELTLSHCRKADTEV
jgi:hypothetical protein